MIISNELYINIETIYCIIILDVVVVTNNTRRVFELQARTNRVTRPDTELNLVAAARTRPTAYSGKKSPTGRAGG